MYGEVQNYHVLGAASASKLRFEVGLSGIIKMPIEKYLQFAKVYLRISVLIFSTLNENEELLLYSAHEKAKTHT